MTKLSIFKWFENVPGTPKAEAPTESVPLPASDEVAAKVKQITDAIKWLNENCAEVVAFDWDIDRYSVGYGLNRLPLRQRGLRINLHRTLAMNFSCT